MNTIEKLQEQLAAAQMKARSPINAVVVKAIAVPNVALESLVAAEAHAVALQDNVRVIDANIQGLFKAANARSAKTLADIDLVNEQYLTEPNEAEAAKLKGYLESLVNQYGIDSGANPSLNNAAYDVMKKERNVAIQALASHMTIVAALAAI